MNPEEVRKVLVQVERWMYDSHQRSHPNNRPWSNYAESVIQAVEVLRKKAEAILEAQPGDSEVPR